MEDMNTAIVSKLDSGKDLHSLSKEAVSRVYRFVKKPTNISFLIPVTKTQDWTAEATDVSFCQAPKLMKEPSNFLTPKNHKKTVIR